MFAHIAKFDSFLKLNVYNTYFLMISFVLLLLALLIGNFFSFWAVQTRLNIYKNVVIAVFFLSFLIFLFYTYVSIHFKSILSIMNIIHNDYSSNHLSRYTIDTSSTIILYLCYLIGFICLLTLGDRFWGLNYQFSIVFIFFLIAINLLCQSSSLFELFVYYEFLLLPSVFLIYTAGYTSKSHQANIFFFIWTQLGSLIVFLGIFFILTRCGSTEFSFIRNYNFSNYETYYLYLLFFFGFGVKVPVWPFHFWLIKVHVEAPSGFSIFLSGFLVKSAVYCFYKIVLLFNIQDFYILPILICILGMLDASIKMWGQLDIKKLIAFATVQEMNAIYFLFNFGDSWATHVGLIFLLAHGILSALMFFLIECVYRRFSSRSLNQIYSVSQLFPNLGIAIWSMLVLFFGFPGTLKFYVEIQLSLILSNTDIFMTVFLLIVFIFINAIGFGRCWFAVLYGHPDSTELESQPSKLDLTSEEALIITLLVFLSITPCFFVYLI